MSDHPEPFTVKDCALIAIATGIKVWTLGEMRDAVSATDAGSIYHHFWGGLLAPRFEERGYNNEFAAWARHGAVIDLLGKRFLHELASAAADGGVDRAVRVRFAW